MARIGQDLRDEYEVPTELPPKLLALVRKLAAIEGKPRSRTLLGRLDANRRQLFVTPRATARTPKCRSKRRRAALVHLRGPKFHRLGHPAVSILSPLLGAKRTLAAGKKRPLQFGVA